MHDFYSDTKTKPTRAMREAMLEAPVGDEQKDEDPTTRFLCERVADLLGKEAAVFMPSGTMCNEIAIRVHCRPGDEIICERSCHVIGFEGGGPAALAGAMVHPIDGVHGRMTSDQVRGAVRYPSRYDPRSRLLSVEQTANLAGGAVWPLNQLNEIASVAKEHGLSTHMDGARLMNAVVSSRTPAADFAAGYDSVWIDFTKGLGAPVGAVLAGSSEFIEEAWRFKQQMGGAMRQSGVLAAMALHALDHHVVRLADDHTRAGRISDHLRTLSKVTAILPVETNIVIFDLSEEGPDAEELADLALDAGVIIGEFGERRIRVVTHLDVDDGSVEALCAVFSAHLS
ncbi:MAG: threonine aldolase family protein [Pseudomonadota bacterium]